MVGLAAVMAAMAARARLVRRRRGNMETGLLVVVLER
jgi:hypothetical protein